MKIKQLLLFVFFISFPFANYSQQWHQYSDSIIANVNKRNYSKAEQFIVLADAEIGQSKIVKDTMYADYLYSKGSFNYFQSQNPLEFFNEALAIWEASKKVNYFKIMKIHYFSAKNYINEQKYELAIESFEKCYEINKKYKLKENRNFTDAVYLLAALYDDKGNVNKARKYADEYISQTQQKAYENFDFNYAKAYQFKNDIAGQEKVLLAFLNNYSQNKQLNNPLLLFGINYELYRYYNKNNRIKETIKYGNNAYEIYQRTNLNSKEELKMIILSLIVKYGEIGDSINHDKYKKLSFSLFPDDETGDYYAELERLMKAGDFETFKIKFYEYEGNLISQGNYDDLFGIYALSITLFEQNILFKKDEINKQIQLIQKNKSSLSTENKLYFEILLAEYYTMTNDHAKSLVICNTHLNEKDINIRLMFYRFKTASEMMLANGDAKRTAYKTLEIASSIYGENDPQLLPYLTLILTVDVMGEDKNTTKIATKTLQILYDNKLEQTDDAVGIWLALGNTAFNKKNIKDARVYYQNAIKILEFTNVVSNPMYYYSCLLQLANVNVLEKNFEKSLEYSNKVKLFLENNPQVPQIAYADYYYQLGDYYFLQDQFKDSKINYEKSFAIYGETISNIRKMNYILCDYFIEDNVDKTINSLEQYQKENNGIAKVSKIIYLLKFNSGNFKVSRDFLVSQLKTVISDNNQYFHLLSDYEKEILYKGFSDQFEFLNTHLLSNDPTFLKEYINFRFYSKSLLFSNSFKLSEQDDKNKELYAELKNNTVLINRDNESKLTDLKETEDLKIRNREIEKFLSAKNEPLIVPTLKDLNIKLKVKEAYVEIIRINKQSRSATKKGIDIVNQFTDSIYYGAIVIKKNAAPKFIVLDDTNMMESNYFPDFQNHIQGNSKLEKDLRSYSLLFEKIESELNKIDKIYLVTDGVYNSINAESIYNTKKGKYLLEYLKIQLIQNVRSITDEKKELKIGSNLKASLFGIPDYTINVIKEDKTQDDFLESEVNNSMQAGLRTKRKLEFLPGAEKEIKEINTILKESNLKVDLYTESNANEDSLKKIESPDILHIATHGFFNKNDLDNKMENSISSLINERSSNPFLNSGLFLSGAQNSLNNEFLDSFNNGILLAEEAKSLNLKNTELVVLSACETGLGENLVGEGVIGLQRAFMIAGAKSVIMSLWKVDDFSTQKLMTLFYTNWIQKKMSKDNAFYAAKLEMKRTYIQPYYWAGFVLLE
jgi:CHAT domain-containing protein